MVSGFELKGLLKPCVIVGGGMLWCKSEFKCGRDGRHHGRHFSPPDLQQAQMRRNRAGPLNSFACLGLVMFEKVNHNSCCVSSSDMLSCERQASNGKSAPADIGCTCLDPKPRSSLINLEPETMKP